MGLARMNDYPCKTVLACVSLILVLPCQAAEKLQLNEDGKISRADLSLGCGLPGHPHHSFGAARSTHLPLPTAASGRRVPRTMWLVWFGRPLSGDRATFIASIQRKYNGTLAIHTVTAENVRSFELPTEPFHPGFELLTAVHKSDYLFAYLAHHYGGGFHDIKKPSVQSWLPLFDKMNGAASAWLVGEQQSDPVDIACSEEAAADDDACLRLRAGRNETRTRFEPVKREPRVSCINGTLDLFDATQGACCKRVRDSAHSLVGVAAFIARPRTPLTADWLAINHRHLDYKLDRLRAHPAPAQFPRCCFHHEFGYPINWAELKGDAFYPMMLKHASHVHHGLPPLPSHVGLKREDVDLLAGGKFGWVDLSQPKFYCTLSPRAWESPKVCVCLSECTRSVGVAAGNLSRRIS